MKLTEEQTVQIVNRLHKYIDTYNNANYATKLLNELLEASFDEGVTHARRRIVSDLGLTPRVVRKPRLLEG